MDAPRSTKALYASIPTGLHHKVKIYAAARDIPIKQVVQDALKNYLEKEHTEKQNKEEDKLDKSNEAMQA